MPLNIYLLLQSCREHAETCDHSDTDSKTAIDQAMLRPHDFMIQQCKKTLFNEPYTKHTAASRCSEKRFGLFSASAVVHTVLYELAACTVDQMSGNILILNFANDQIKQTI